MARDIESLKYSIGYDFQNRQLLREALTHRSYAVENNLHYDNQRLEFLGDAVLEIVLTEYLFKLYPTADEGQMTKMRSALAQQESLARLARQLELGAFLLTGRGETGANGAARDSTLADLFEALLGAYYLDAGLAAAREFVLAQLRREYPAPHRLLVTLNPKGALQEYTQHLHKNAPSYEVLEVTGPEHNPVFSVRLTLDTLCVTGKGSSRKLAEVAAALAAITAIAETDESIRESGLSLPQPITEVKV